VQSPTQIKENLLPEESKSYRGMAKGRAGKLEDAGAMKQNHTKQTR
jgi:hypothetical protein